MRRRTILAAILVLVSLAGPLTNLSGPLAASAAGDCTATVTSLADPLTAGVWKFIMDTRAQSGEAAFTWSPSLAQAAAWMAKDAATRGDVASDADSLGRTVSARDTDCGYRADAQVAESLSRDGTGIPGVFINDPFNAWTIWRQGDVSRLYAILYSPVLYPPTYTVGALGRYRNSDGVDYWVLNVGTLSDSGAAPTPTRTAVPTATRTPIPPTPTGGPPTATPIPTATPDTYPVERTCELTQGEWPGPVVLACDS